MSNYSKQMVIAIANDLENSNIPNYDNFKFKEHEESAVFEVNTDLKLTEKKIISCIFVDCDDEGDDRVINTTILNDKISNQFIEETKKLIDVLNECWCDEASFFIEEKDEDTFVIIHREVDYFDEDEIFDEDNEDELEDFLSITASGVAAFEVLTKSLYLIIDEGYSATKAIKENPLLINVLETNEKSENEDSSDRIEYVDYQKNFVESLYELMESEDFDSILENTLERAESEDAEAQYMLGKIYQCLGDDYEDEDDDFDKDESAFYWFAKAAKQGFGLAMFEVAEEYRRGNVVELDGDASIMWFKMAIEALQDSDEGMKKQAVADAYFKLALLHEIDLTSELDGHTLDKKVAFNYMLESAKRGSFVACARVADYYRDGSGTSQDDSQAQIWYEKTVELINAYGVDKKDLLKRCNAEIEKLKAQQHSKTNIVFPVTYGKTKFENMDDVIKQKNTNPDALGFYSHCCIFGNAVKKNVGIGVDGLFAAANAGSTDAILSLGRLYEYGYEFMRQNLDAAITLYKYAYSLKNIDALHSLGLILFTSFDKKKIGLSMMRKAAELGSKNASVQLELIQEDTQNVDVMLFDEIPQKEFQYDEFALAEHLQLYAIDLEDKNAVKDAILEIMSSMPPETFSIIMNEFRTRYLRNRKFSTFQKTVDFPSLFDALVADGLVETRKVDDYGATENTIYIAKGSTQKMKSHTLDWDV